VPNPDNEAETITIEMDVNDVEVTFTDDSYSPSKTYTRTVNVSYDSEGAYDDAATKIVIEQVMLGVQNKFALGLI